jgi:hypothetical protein
MMFAASNAVDPAIGWQIVLFIAFAFSVGANVAQVWNTRRAQDRNVSIKDGVATVKDVQSVKLDLEVKVAAVASDLSALETKVDTSVSKLSDELKDCETRITTKGEERVIKVHDRINEVLSAVSEVRGELNARFDK